MKAPYFYDCGVELEITGNYGRHTYNRESILSLNALYHLLFVNFSALTVGLFTQPNGERCIKGKLLSPALPIRNYCTAKLRTLWFHLYQTMKMPIEEVSLLSKIMMQKFLEVIPTVAPYIGKEG